MFMTELDKQFVRGPSEPMIALYNYLEVMVNCYHTNQFFEESTILHDEAIETPNLLTPSP
jgi:hypothetical protein